MINVKPQINILGTVWNIVFQDESENDVLEKRDGYTDKTNHTIVICKDRGNTGFYNYDENQKVCLRHEIIHAFLIESGLDSNFQHPNEFGHDETTVDWFDMQWHKINKVFEELDI